MKPTQRASIGSRVLDTGVAGLRIMGTTRLLWFDSLFRNTDRISVGRTQQRHVRIRDGSVSRLHCMIEKLGPGRYQIVDCGASNGVMVRTLGPYSGYVQVATVELNLLMRIRLGRVKLAPVNASGRSAMIVETQRALVREAYDIYGSFEGIERHVGLSAARASRIWWRRPKK